MKTKLYGKLLLAFLAIHTISNAQDDRFIPHSKGHGYLHWGWNRSMYSNSTLTLKGDDYSLKLHDMAASDRPTSFNAKDYFRIDRLTIPQNNWRLGYFIKDNLAITLGTDHMKYVMNQNQTVNIDGYITRESPYKGTYNNTPTVLTEDFLTFEHTDGLNYVNIGLEKYNTLARNKTDNLIINGMFGVGSGVMFPKTNAKLLDYQRNDRFHISGFGVSAKAALEAVLFKGLIIKFEASGGYINMPNIILHEKGVNGKGKQAFFFTEFDGVVGWNFWVHKPRPKKIKES